ncbi:hypothetical protein N7474_009276 [Penicillium riverlandense]|uniref:uncharacterized protein n=1 Tax=Penicillium riverlandense TaxID=1903569 RepID=UPI0025496A1D|nr:uncharacterized protein N7474_009276 [Penicillium riverlandense]KAJ5808007.1 hypothetical protein N7474_009276 [Penicillium riverlandense]
MKSEDKPPSSPTTFPEPSKMSFLSCPPETSHQIISYLDSSRDVAALSLACRALHSMCNMPMRKKFHLIRVYPDDEGIEQAFGLLMSILKQPSLGQYVREIRYYGRPTHSGDWENVKKEQHPRDLSESEMDLLKSYVRRAGFTGSNENSVLNMLVQKKTGGNRERESYFDGGYVR